MAVVKKDLLRPPKYVAGSKDAKDALSRSMFMVGPVTVSISDTSPATIFEVPANTFVDEIIAVKTAVQNGVGASDAATISVGDSDGVSILLPAASLNLNDLGTTSSKAATASDALYAKGHMYSVATPIFATITVPTADAASDQANAGTVKFYCKYRSFVDEI